MGLVPDAVEVWEGVGKVKYIWRNKKKKTPSEKAEKEKKKKSADGNGCWVGLRVVGNCISSRSLSSSSAIRTWPGVLWLSITSYSSDMEMELISPQNSPFECILFDLDDTLYDGEIGIRSFLKKNIEDFLSTKCKVSPEKAFTLRSEFFSSHGSSLAALLALGYDIHPDEYHSYVHGKLPYELIQPDTSLLDLLQSIRQTKILFTNSDRKHAKKALMRLGIDESIFERIICFETLNPHLFSDDASSPTTDRTVVLKPSPLAFHAAIKIAGYDPHRMLFVDDSQKNVVAGKSLGLNTALVGKKVVKCEDADYLLEGILLPL